MLSPDTFARGQSDDVDSARVPTDSTRGRYYGDSRDFRTDVERAFLRTEALTLWQEVIQVLCLPTCCSTLPPPRQVTTAVPVAIRNKAGLCEMTDCSPPSSLTCLSSGIQANLTRADMSPNEKAITLSHGMGLVIFLRRTIFDLLSKRKYSEKCNVFQKEKKIYILTWLYRKFIRRNAFRLDNS